MKKKCSESLNIKEEQIKTTIKYLHIYKNRYVCSYTEGHTYTDITMQVHTHSHTYLEITCRHP